MANRNKTTYLNILYLCFRLKRIVKEAPQTSIKTHRGSALLFKV